MAIRSRLTLFLAAMALAACGGGSGDSTTATNDVSPDAGTLTLAITDGPMEEARELVLHLTHVDVGHWNGDVTRLPLRQGPVDLDMMGLQNGLTHDLLRDASLPAGRYRWLELGVDFGQSHVGLNGGAHHPMTLGDPEAMRVHDDFEIHDGRHLELVMDFDLRLGLQHHHMGGRMGDRYEIHHGLHLMHTEDVGGLMGVVDPTLVDVNHPDCDPAPGGNWAYLFAGDAGQPDDLAQTDTDGFAGPVATDHIDLHIGAGDYRYHFAFVPAGSYRVAVSCSSEWDETGDDDYPDDPDDLFDFQFFSEPVDVVAGQMSVVDLGP